jgi:hypothetical protein
MKTGDWEKKRLPCRNWASRSRRSFHGPLGGTRKDVPGKTKGTAYFVFRAQHRPNKYAAPFSGPSRTSATRSYPRTGSLVLVALEDLSECLGGEFFVGEALLALEEDEALSLDRGGVGFALGEVPGTCSAGHECPPFLAFRPRKGHVAWGGR